MWIIIQRIINTEIINYFFENNNNLGIKPSDYLHKLHKIRLEIV